MKSNKQLTLLLGGTAQFRSLSEAQDIARLGSEFRLAARRDAPSTSEADSVVRTADTAI